MKHLTALQTIGLWVLGLYATFASLMGLFSITSNRLLRSWASGSNPGAIELRDLRLVRCRNSAGDLTNYVWASVLSKTATA